jgi:hypothetical protein
VRLLGTALIASIVLLLCGAAHAVPGTIVWRTGGGTLGQWKPVDGNGQCPGVVPTIRGTNASFTVLRNKNASYTWHGRTFPGASTCWRNQINPIDPETGSNFLLRLGAHYTFTFQTVVTLNGNYRFEDTKNGGLAVGVPAIVWQTHSYGQHISKAWPDGGGPCDLLVIQNTYREWSAGGIQQYGHSLRPGGLPVWNFHTCDENDFTGHAYNSPDTLHDGQIDNWQIDITAQIQYHPGGSVVVRRNGAVVYDAPSHVCDGSWPECWWNFGPYMFYWENSEEPPGWNDAGVTVQVNNMTLYKQ